MYIMEMVYNSLYSLTINMTCFFKSPKDKAQVVLA